MAQNPSDLIKAHEFAHHLTSSQKHGTLFHLVKFYPIQSAISAVVLFFIFLALAVFIVLNVLSSVDTTDNYTYSETDITSDYTKENEIALPAFSMEEPETKNLDNDADVLNDQMNHKNSDTYTDVHTVYYATQNGKKYHISGCSYISGKQTVTVSKNDIDNGKYTSCSRCIG